MNKILITSIVLMVLSAQVADARPGDRHRQEHRKINREIHHIKEDNKLNWSDHEAIRQEQFQQYQQNQKRMDGFDRRLNGLEKDMNIGLATVSAMTGLVPNPRDTSPIQLAIGVGTYKSEIAGAAGLFGFINDRVMTSVKVGFSEHSVATSIGFTIGIGR